MSNNTNSSKDKANKKKRKPYKGNWRHEGKDNYYDLEETRKKYSTNDPSWYGANKALLTDSSSIPFSWSFGTKLDIGLDYPGVPGISDVVPGIMVERLIPVVGNTVTQENIPNVAAFSAYSFIRHENSGHSNYDSPDLMMYLMACAEIYSYIVFLQRCYGMAMTFAQKNRYFPKALLVASGVDYEDVVNHLADFRMRINVLINKMSSMAVPATMPYFNRMAFNFKNLYIDGTNIKNQLYMYAPAGFHVFTHDATTGRGYLQWRPWPNHSSYNISQLIQMAEDMIQPIIEDEDMNIMSGDILKAYGAGNIITLTSVPEMYNIIPTYDVTVLEQMKNASIFNGVTNLDIDQDPTTSVILCAPKTTYAVEQHIGVSNRVLTTVRDEPGPEAVMEITRLMASVEKVGTEYYINCGSEICCDVTYYSLNPLTQELVYINCWQYESATLSEITMDEGLLKGQSILSNFKFHPALYVFVRPTASEELTYYGMNYDIDNYAVLSSADIAKMHTAAVLNMLNVPSIGKANVAGK